MSNFERHPLDKREKHPMTESLNNMGLFVRDYSEGVAEALNYAASSLHNELCKLDATNLKPWEDIKLVDFINAWVRTKDGYRSL